MSNSYTQTGGRERSAFIQALSLRDVVLMIAVAVISLRWVTRGARAGSSSILLWCLAGLFFFVPLAFAAAELSAKFPDQGGLYVWTLRAFGPGHGFFCAWCLWLNQIFYFPSYLLFAQANFLSLGGTSTSSLASSRIFTTFAVLVLLWLLTWLNIVGFGVSKWLQNLGSIGIWIPMALLFAFAAILYVRNGSATPFVWHDLVPRSDGLSALSLWSSMCFAFSGVEIAALVSQEIQRPQRTIPAAIGIAGALITAMYVGGSVAILCAVPASGLNERTGLADAISVASTSSSAGALVSLLIGAAAVATTSSWIAGAARVPFAVACEDRLPGKLAALHPRHRTPATALIMQALGASAVLLVSMFLSIGPLQTTVSDAYDVLVNLAILLYFVPYVYLFCALVRLGSPNPAPGSSFLSRRAPVRMCDRYHRGGHYRGCNRAAVYPAPGYFQYPEL